MSEVFFTVTWGAGAFLVVWILLDIVMPRVMRRIARMLPNDICGPGSWYVDTADSSGIFDRPNRRRGV